MVVHPGGQEGLPDDLRAVVLGLVDRPARPQPRRENPAGDAEVVPVMASSAALAGGQPGFREGGLDAVAEPVRAPRRAGQPPEFGVQSVQVPGKGRIGSVGVGLADCFGEVLGELADGLVGVLGDDALEVQLSLEPHDVRRRRALCIAGPSRSHNDQRRSTQTKRDGYENCIENLRGLITDRSMAPARAITTTHAATMPTDLILSLLDPSHRLLRNGVFEPLTILTP